MIQTNSSGSKCPNCKNTLFESVLESPARALRSVTFIRCSSCKTVVGVMEPESLTVLLKRIIDRIGA